jgi:hypothetical protein
MQANQYFFPWSTAENQHNSMLKSVFDMLASNSYPEFIAMSYFLNTKKGDLFNYQVDYLLYTNNEDWLIPQDGYGWSWGSTGRSYSARDSLREMISHFENILYAVLEMNAGGSLALMDKTNRRIYAAL